METSKETKSKGKIVEKVVETAKFQTCENSMVAYRAAVIEKHLKGYWKILIIKEIQCEIFPEDHSVLYGEKPLVLQESKQSL